MLDTKLITRQEIQKYKQLSNSSKNAKLDEAIVEAQLQDIKPLLGWRLFNALMKDVQDTGTTDGTTYIDLQNGGHYTDKKGCERYNPGLKAVLAQYVYGRNIMWGDVVDNPFGATNKLNNPESRPIDYATKKSRYNESNSLAYNIWTDVRKWLIETKEPLFKKYASKPKTQFKLKKIGR